MAMAPKNISHAIAFLTGEVHALFMVSQAFALSHPDPSKLLVQLDYAEQAGLANIENQPLKDNAVIEGYQFAAQALRKAVEVATGNRQT
jgi:hypothetical protein